MQIGDRTEEAMTYKYFGVEISSKHDIHKVEQQTHKGTAISGYIRDIIRRLTHHQSLETRVVECKTKQVEMTTLRSITGKFSRHRIPSRGIGK